MLGGAREESGGDGVLVHFWPTLDASRSNEMHSIAITAHYAGSRPNVIGNNPIAPLGFALRFSILDNVFGFGRESDDQRRPNLGWLMCDGGENIRVFS